MPALSSVLMGIRTITAVAAFSLFASQGRSIQAPRAPSVLNEAHQRAIRIHNGCQAPTSGLLFGQMQPRLTAASFQDPGVVANLAERIQIIKAQTTAEPTRQRIEVPRAERIPG